ncbi:Hypothetical protein NTJ_01723 [Nesidiocoris tenuis]|uniref:Uncharacterized protein n=1 Tax=Nesidiocoris tenuis TaxID=355587 RepID=A0ABN7A9B9_9HEMI|nr:Hypothetical protein NTJ_01723 [Nesidiocoris tenuis]
MMTTEKLRKVRQETLHHHADWSAEEDGRGRKLLFRCRPPPGGRSPSPRMKGTVAPDVGETYMVTIHEDTDQ